MEIPSLMSIVQRRRFTDISIINTINKAVMQLSESISVS